METDFIALLGLCYKLYNGCVVTKIQLTEYIKYIHYISVEREACIQPSDCL